MWEGKVLPSDVHYPERKKPGTSRALNFFHLEERKWCFAAEDKSHMQARVEIGKENTTLLHSPHLKV